MIKDDHTGFFIFAADMEDAFRRLGFEVIEK
jgi:hypothetical protein